jgi:hypothetical protein
MEIVLVHNFVGYHADGYAYVFISFQWRPEIIVIYVHVHIEGRLGGTHAVKDCLRDGEIRCFRCYFTRVLNPITSDCHSYSMGIGFVWFVSTHEFDIRWKSSLWDCFVLDEKTCVCALDAAFVSLKESAIFIAIAFFSRRLSFWIQKQLAQIESFPRHSVCDFVCHVPVIFGLNAPIVCWDEPHDRVGCLVPCRTPSVVISSCLGS